MKKSYITILLMIFFGVGCNAQNDNNNSVLKNKMSVTWNHDKGRIYFEMTAPTDGWVTIGFNTSTGTKGAYLLMGNVVHGKVSLVEHYTLSAGNYKSIISLGEQKQVSDISGFEKDNKTVIKFSLPIKAASKYQKDLSKGKEYTMIVAYSQEDDFQHHSIMRTSEQVKL